MFLPTNLGPGAIRQSNAAGLKLVLSRSLQVHCRFHTLTTDAEPFTSVEAHCGFNVDLAFHRARPTICNGGARHNSRLGSGLLAVDVHWQKVLYPQPHELNLH